MSTAKWIIFVIQLLFEYGPKLIALGRDIYQWVERNKGGQPSEEKRLAFNDMAKLPENKEKLVAKLGLALQGLDEYREKICQRVNGKNWVSKDNEFLGTAIAWRGKYDSMNA